MDDKNAHKAISELILKFLQDNLTDNEKTELDSWLNEDPANPALLESFRDTATVQKEINYLRAVDTNSAWEKVAGQISGASPRASKTNWWRWSAAAVILIGLSVAVSINHFKSGTKPKALTARQAHKHKQDIQPGTQQATLKLADGTVVSLNGSQRHLKEKNGVDIQAEKGLLAYHDEQTSTKEQAYNTLTTPKAGQYKLQLPDGTLVWLNAASSLRFPVSFEGAERRVELTGEAYFEVAKTNKPSSDSRLPFIVSFNGTEVEVLGTHFNINSYMEPSRTTLLEGSIKIKKGAAAKILQPNQRAVVTPNGSITTATVNPWKDIAWTNGLFYFDQDNLGEIMQQVARWYDIQVSFEGKQDNRSFKGTIRRQATLNQVLEMLSAVSGNTFTLNDRTVTVHSK